MMTSRGNSPPNNEAKLLKARWPSEWRDGARCAFLETFEGAREEGGYPAGFHIWELDRRNAWFCGYVRGFFDRLRVSEEG
jgi:hypothetical protein